MKTAKEYLGAQTSGHPAAPFISYAEALAAVQAALDDAASVREEVRQGIADCFGGIMPFELPPELPADKSPIRLGQPAHHNVFPPACPRCLLRRDQCVCPPMFPREEPPF